MSDVRCPYCGGENEVDTCVGEGTEENTTYQMQCRSCEMSFTYTANISFSYDAEKVPCLNGGEHKLMYLVPQNEFNFGKKYCEYCGEEFDTEPEKRLQKIKEYFEKFKNTELWERLN